MVKHILVPLDGSEYAEKALDFAQTLALATKAHISLLTVIMRFGAVLPNQRQLEASSHAHITEYLHPIRDMLARNGLDVSAHVDFGNPADAIADFARQESVDLIVMATHGVGSRSTYALGSVALKVLQIAPCPVTMKRVVEPASRHRVTSQERLGSSLSTVSASAPETSP
ncbi:MAG: universal stress protein [Chloroflexi bacterium]|nr:universal stress protein [Chloroflexota bacterium]